MIEYGGFWKRLMAYTIDIILLSIVFDYITKKLGFHINPIILKKDQIDIGFAKHQVYYTVNAITQIVYYLIYDPLLTASKLQGSIGKKVFGLIVVSQDYKKISLAQSYKRATGKSLGAILFYIGYLMIFFSKQKKSFQDKFASTYVVVAKSIKTSK